MTLHMGMQAVPGYGVNRGPGEAPMFWGDESDEHSAQFQTELLPLDPSALKDAQLIGVGRATPELRGSGEDAGLREVSGSPGSATTRRRLSPRHRRAVGTFFNQTQKDR